MSPCAKLFAVTIDCPRPRELSEFYQRFLDGQLRSANPDFVVLTSERDVRIDFQRVHNHVPDRWPNPESPHLHPLALIDDATVVGACTELAHRFRRSAGACQAAQHPPCRVEPGVCG